MDMVRRHTRMLAAVAGLALVATACGAGEDAEPDDAAGDEAEAVVEDEPEDGVETDDVAAEGLPVTAADRGLDVDDWDAVVEAARGTTVNFHMWGGSETINGYVTDVLGGHLADEYDIELNLVPLADTADGVNTVLSEIQAGRDTDGGSVDMIWINGENYFTMNQADALLLEWERDIPNSEFVAWDNESINRDFGIPVEGQAPWNMSAWQLVYDSDRLDESDVPRTFAELREWIEANPGRFTYPEPPTFQGTRFVQYGLFDLSGGIDQWLEIDEGTFVEDSRIIWEYLKDIEPNLWQQGQTYPADISAQNTLFANGEIDFTFTFTYGGISAEVDEGIFPESARVAVMDNLNGGSANFIGVPANTSNPAGALVALNASLEPSQQLAKFDPNGGPALGLVIELDRVDAESQAVAAEMVDSLAPYGLPPQELQANQIGNGGPELLNAIDEAWGRYVRQGEPLP